MKVYCNIRILGSVVLQYSGMDGLEVYCNTLICIAEKRVETVLQYSSLYCDSRGSGLLDYVVTQGRDTASQATKRRRGARGTARARGARHGRAGRGTGAWGAARARGARYGPAGRGTGAWGAARAHGAARARGARHGRWACGMGVLLANMLCTRCTQPNFDPV